MNPCRGPAEVEPSGSIHYRKFLAPFLPRLACRHGKNLGGPSGITRFLKAGAFLGMRLGRPKGFP